MGCATEPAIRHEMVVSGCLFWQLSGTFWISCVNQFLRIAACLVV